jgi:hypothetical protein
MAVPQSVAEFLTGSRFAVAGVSRDTRQPANAIYRKLRASGYEVVAVGSIDGLVVASPPGTAIELVRQSADRRVSRIWFHRSLGTGSVAADAVRECEVRGLSCIVGGCPLMYCEPVDPFHRCLRWVLRWWRRVPG